MEKYYTLILNFFFPEVCFWCWREWSYICTNCHRDLQAHPDICPVCHRRSQFWNTCLNCFKESPLSGVMIGFSYSWLIKKLIRAIKYNHTTDCISTISKKLALLIQTTPFHSNKNILISYVPIHRWKKWMVRWYNQAQLLAEATAQQVWLPCVELFTKQRWTRSQTNFKKSKRASNISWSFALHPWLSIPKNTTIILVDDVMTTWSTLQELWWILKEQHPTVRIYWLVIARHW